MKLTLSIRFLFFTTVFAMVTLSHTPARADSTEPKGFKFQPVRSEDWPETGETESGNGSSNGDDGEGDARAPAASGGMPDMKMNPDGTIDPESFKNFF
jgi:hypothetical protein